MFWVMGLNVIPTDHENALYFLSAIVQSQATIITLVITMTLIAIQMASASYTPRVVEVMKKNPDMWILLFTYLVAISYGFVALKLVAVPDRFLVSSILVLGVFTFWILFLYMKNTIKMLRPDTIVMMLVGEINETNLKASISKVRPYHEKCTEDFQKDTINVQESVIENDILQPVFDIVHASIKRFDVTTTRTGLNAVSNKIQELLHTFPDEEGNETEADRAKISLHFRDHLLSSALIAIRNDDEAILKVFNIVLQQFGHYTVDKKIGISTHHVAYILEEIGIHAADKGLEFTTEGAVYVLGELGTHAADDMQIDSTKIIAEMLGKVGIHAADNRLDNATWRVAYALGVVGTRAANKNMIYPTRRVTDALKDTGIHAVEKELRYSSGWVVDMLKKIGTLSTEKDREFETALLNVAEALQEIGNRALDKDLKDVTKNVVDTLCYLGARESGRKNAAKELAQLALKNSIVTGFVEKFESKLETKNVDRFAVFKKNFNEELQKLKTN